MHPVAPPNGFDALLRDGAEDEMLRGGRPRVHMTVAWHENSSTASKLELARRASFTLGT